jgi:polyisoprenoid-binding protein YceI
LIRIILPAILILFSASDKSVVYLTNTGYAEFTSRVPLHTFKGQSNHLTGMIDPDENLIDFYLDLNTLKTGIDRRDRDMYRTLNVNEFPFAEFTGSLKHSFNPESSEKQEVIASGEFTIHGVTREVNINGVIQVTEYGLLLEAEWTISLNEYEIEPPGILFYRVNDEQQVCIEAVLRPRDKETISTEGG